MEIASRRKPRYGKRTTITSDATAAIFGAATAASTLPVLRTQVTLSTPAEKAAFPSVDQQPSRPVRVQKTDQVGRAALDDITDQLNNATLNERPADIESLVLVDGKHIVEQATELLSRLDITNDQPILATPKKDSPKAVRRSPRRLESSQHGYNIKTTPKPEPATKTSEDSRKKPTSPSDPRLVWLEPLVTAYSKKSGSALSIKPWSTLLSPSWTITKIAESSFAEVYKVCNKLGSSILKLMALRPPSGPGSQRETSVPIDLVLSEVLIMNLMTDLPGFVEFKAAHVISGRPPAALCHAFEMYAEEKETWFPRPNRYPREQLFLALELGDAGTDVESFSFTSETQVWDLFLGVVTALATGEEAFEFEHRDLHEGNVCLRQVGQARPLPKDSACRLGYSGLEVTLLDYTLSRATHPPPATKSIPANTPAGTKSSRSKNPNHRTKEVIYLDLEADPELFAPSPLLQRQIYRRMRTWLYFRTHSTTHARFDMPLPPATATATQAPHPPRSYRYNTHHQQHHNSNTTTSSWRDFTPYSNVLWIHFILEWAIWHFNDGKATRVYDEAAGGFTGREDVAGEVARGQRWRMKGLEAFLAEIAEVRRLLGPEVRVFEGGFVDAVGVYEYCVGKGWIPSPKVEA